MRWWNFGGGKNGKNGKNPQQAGTTLSPLIISYVVRSLSNPSKIVHVKLNTEYDVSECISVQESFESPIFWYRTDSDFFYETGGTTPLTVSSTSTGSPTTTDFLLDSAGYLTLSSTRVIPHVQTAYKLIMYLNQTDADADTTGSAVWTIDNITLGSDITSLGPTIAQYASNGDYFLDRKPFKAEELKDAVSILLKETDDS